MASNTTYVTVGDTPNCDACHSYYSERFCEDCNQYQCTWCNLDIHVPIGKRNHHRPRLYGEDKYAHLEAPAISTADQAIADSMSKSSFNKDGSSSSGDANIQNKFTVDPTTGRVNVTTEHFFDISAEEGWDLLGDWDCPFLPFSVDVNDSNDRRVLSLPVEIDEEEDEEAEGSEEDEEANSERTKTILITERLIQRDEREMFYSYSRLVPPDAGFPYTDLLSKYAFVPMANGPNGEKKCVLQWTTSVLCNDVKNPRIAAEAVAKFQEGWKPFFDTAIQMED